MSDLRARRRDTSSPIAAGSRDHCGEHLRGLEMSWNPGDWGKSPRDPLGTSPVGLDPSHPRLGGHDSEVAGVEPAVPACPQECRGDEEFYRSGQETRARRRKSGWCCSLTESTSDRETKSF